MACSLSLEDVKLIDQKGKDIVNGYIKQIQSVLPSENVYYTQ